MRKLIRSKPNTFKQKQKRSSVVARRGSIPIERLLSTESSGQPGLRYLQLGSKFGIWVIADAKKRFKSVERI